ncbi:MAG: hypothetical protein HY929_02630 [Euryarchaeota archaeon]|nr:hypothetical protein [Euryarchaeota archaeon]
MVKICPKCRSPRIKYALWWTTAQIYECEDCGYRGSLIIEEEKT